MRQIHSIISQLDFNNKTVLLRIDGSVPLDKKTILDDYKLERVNPTLSHIIQHNGCAIILTHIGNPKEISDDLSTKILLPWFEKKGYQTRFCATLSDLQKISKIPKTIILFENTRFFKEEKSLDVLFARKLAACADLYIFDAFGALHRDETTISVLPFQFEQKKRSIGFLVEDEYNTLIQKMKIHPSVLIVGGAKAEQKINLVLDCAHFIDTILLCPLLSTVETGIPKNMQRPLDYFVYDGKTKERKIENLKTNKITPDYEIISIGEETIRQYQQIIEKAGVVIWNGFMGFLDKKETLQSSLQLAHIITTSSAYSIIAGGDTCSFIRTETNLQQKMSKLLTGGGSTLSILGHRTLPGLKAFLE